MAVSRFSLGGPVPRTGSPSAPTRSPDQHHHRRPAAEDLTFAGAGISPVVALAAKRMIEPSVGHRFFAIAQPGSRRFVAMMAVGAEADPAIADFFDLFAAPPAAVARGQRGVNEMGPRHIDLSGLTVPTLVIGSTKDLAAYRCARPARSPTRGAQPGRAGDAGRALRAAAGNIPEAVNHHQAPWCRRCSRSGASADGVLRGQIIHHPMNTFWRTDGAPSCAP